MFQETKEGETHSHTWEKKKWEEEFDRNFKYVFSEKDPIYGAENTQNKNAIKIFISHAISEAVEEERVKSSILAKETANEAVEEERERIAYHLKYIDWTNSQTGIAIGTKKAVIEEALSIINEKGFPSSVNF